MKRRRFMFWIGLGLFSLGEKLRANAFAELAASIMGDDAAANPIHWRAASINKWQWYEQETFKYGKWTLTGVTTPIIKETGEPFTEHKGYLDPSLVPKSLRVWDGVGDEEDESAEDSEHLP